MEAVLESLNASKKDLQGDEYLAFIIDGVTYGISVDFVTEIIEISKITPVPSLPIFIKGIFNLRGCLIPAMDLRLRLGIAEKEYDERTCIIIVSFDRNRDERVGLVVDMVSEVFEIPETDIERSFRYKLIGDENFLDGVGKVDDKALMILDVSAIINPKETTELISISSNI